MERTGRVGAALVGGAGLVVLLGWYVGNPALTRVLPGEASMKPNTAVGLLLVAVALLTQRRRSLPLGGAVVLLGLATLIEYVFAISLGIDRLLPGVDFRGGPSRMAPASAISLVLLGGAVLAGQFGRGRTMRGLAIGAFGVGQVAVLGYSYGVSSLYTVGDYTSMALVTALCVVVLAFSALLTDPSAGLVGLLRDSGSAGRLLRPLIPFLLFGPALLGWLSLRAAAAGWFDSTFAASLLVMSLTIVGGALSWWVAVRLRALDRQRSLVVAELAESNRTLEARVADRTRDLAARQNFTDAVLETVDVGIVSCDATGAALVRNRTHRAMLGLAAESLDLAPEAAAGIVDVLDSDERRLAPDQYPLVRTLNGEDVGTVDLLLGPPGGPHREVVARGSRIIGTGDELQGAVVVLTDVTAERTASRALEAERGWLIEAQRVGQLGSFEYDFATDTWAFSDQMCAVWGVEVGGLTLELTHALMVDQDREAATEAWSELCRVGGRSSHEYRIRRLTDGADRLLRSNIEVDLNAAGIPHRGRGTHLDITDLAAAEQAATDANAFFNAVLAATPDYTFVSDLTTGTVTYGSRDKDILGITTAQISALEPAARLALVHVEDQPRLAAINAAAVDLEDGATLQLRYRGMHADGEWRWLNRRVTPFRRDATGAVAEVLGVVRDITDVMEAEDRLTHAALHDGLTGLPNRALLIDRLDAALARSGRDGREVAVLFCDLDGFKRVNDTAGHAAGDALLLEIARRLHSVLRDDDTVARVGGDEFVVIVEPWNRRDQVEPRLDAQAQMDADRILAVRVAERLTEALRLPVAINGVEHVVTTSIGITYATLGPGGVPGRATADQILQDADAAMYLAKGRGKDRYEVFESGLQTDLAERGRVEHTLRQALGARARVGGPTGMARFGAAYQPVFSSRTGELMGFEALARLTDADGLDIPPDVFIAVAEETGLIHPLGRLVLELACSQLAAWRVEVPGLERISMAVNMSALQAQQSTLGDDVRHALLAHRLDPSDLVLELTETALLQVANSTITALRALRASGVGIAIDDFGTGYASLRYLATLPVSSVKVDKSFTAGLPDDATSRIIVNAVAALAADMGLVCVVEGVETVEQLNALPHDVQVQGYLMGRPERPETLDVLGLCTQGMNRPASLL